jgi:hypothetical protein
MRVSVIIPTHNEAQAIERVLADLPSDLTTEVIVVDSNSNDGTPEIAARMGARVIQEPRRGYGRACLTGLATANSPDVVVFLDGDYSDRPSELPILLAPITEGRADITLGSRLHGESSAGALPWHQAFGNRLAASLIRLLYGLKISDLGPFRAGRVNAVSGVVGQPETFYFGSVGGGVWKTNNAGRTWKPVFDSQSAASIGAIQRGLLGLEQQGAEKFIGEPMLNVDDLLQTSGGKGVINILAADKLMNAPKLYSTMLLWLLSELYERLPEIGDPEKPKLVFFFDEAHLLFTDAPKALLDRIEQVVRLVRSKGVGVFFVTQNPLDVPDTVLGQLGNRVQHALRAFTPRDQKAVKTAADTLRPNPKLDVGSAITELAVGEALVSLLDAKGSPTVTERAWIVPPASQIGPITDVQRDAIQKQATAIYGRYAQTVDRESAYEKLLARAGGAGTAGLPTEARSAEAGGAGGAGLPTEAQSAKVGTGSAITDALSSILLGTTGPRGGHHDGLVQSAAKSAARSVGSGLGRAILRGALGSILGGTTSRSRSRR